MLDATELRVKAKVGTLYPQAVRTDFLAPFRYEPSWLGAEHAFLLDYKPAERPKYIEAFLANLDVDAAEGRFTGAADRPVG